MNLTMEGYHIADAPVKAIYDGQKSGIRVSTFLPKVAFMLLIGQHTRIIRNTLNNPSLPIVITWVTYIAGWVYNPLLFVVTHLSDRIHVSHIRRDLNENAR